MQWAKEATYEMEYMKKKVIGNLKEIDVYHIVQQIF
jgi:hypothetical protein